MFSKSSSNFFEFVFDNHLGFCKQFSKIFLFFTLWPPVRLKMAALEISFTYRKQKNHRAPDLGCRECEESLPHHAKSRNHEQRCATCGLPLL